MFEGDLEAAVLEQRGGRLFVDSSEIDPAIGKVIGTELVES